MEPLSTSSVVCETSLDSLHNATLDISNTARPCHLRMVDCKAFTTSQLLRILEFDAIPPEPYCAISYVWKGNSCDPRPVDTPDESASFSVAGAEDGDPISLVVLHYACLAALHFDAPYIWLDRLCIIQTSRTDKSWQITQMYQVYKRAQPCVILPGGVQRLVGIDEETGWIHRGWTLQEVLAPAGAAVLFIWERGEGIVAALKSQAWIEEIEPGRVAVADVTTVVDACIEGQMRFTTDKEDFSFEKAQTLPVRIFGERTSNLAALGTALVWIESEEHLGDACCHAIWQCALMRTSSRPVDMVFSIMGLFDVALDPKSFHKDDRIGATVALAREILRKGQSASWVGASFRMPPSRTISTFPQFPRTSVAGKAEIETPDGLVEVGTLFDGEYPGGPGGVLMKMPKGEMDEDGYFTFQRKAAVLIADCNDHSSGGPVECLTALDGTRWILQENLPLVEEEFPRTAAIALGFYTKYQTLPENVLRMKMMLAQEHAPGKFHVSSFLALQYKLWRWRVDEWREYTFTVGGPEHFRPRN